jgi:cyclopropane-fatty-acyl-phospholipid synthase
MAPSSRRAPTTIDCRLAAGIQRGLRPGGVRLVLWDGSTPGAGDAAGVGDIVVRDRATLLRLALYPERWFGDAYAAGRLEVRGPLARVLEALWVQAGPRQPWRERVAALVTMPIGLRLARRNAARHYDVGNDFYSRWLGRDLVYTCAYFPTPETPLDAAQTAKLDRVCRKLRLRAGERVLELGCGWGGLALHMARRYGVRVTAFNVAREQIEYARARAGREGLDGAVTFVDDDFRNASGRFDAVVSVGMLEHVGRREFSALSRVLRECVRRDGGRGLLHFIGRDTPQPLNAWIRRRIFPGAYLPTLAEVAGDVLATAGMTVLDVENLRLHYARTLAHWARQFAAAAADIDASYGRWHRRTWELYLAGAEASFAAGTMQLFQVLFAPHDGCPPYWSRDVVAG